MRTERYEDMRYCLGIIVLMILFALLTGGCATQKNAEKFYRNNPEELAKKCAEAFPPTVAKRDTIYTPGDSSAYLQTIDELQQSVIMLNNINDSLLNVVLHDPNCSKYSQALQSAVTENKRLQGKIAGIICPKDIVQITTEIESTGAKARIKAQEFELANKDVEIGILKDRLAKAEKEKEEALAAKRKWFWYFWILVAVIGVIIGVRLKGKIPFL